MTDRPDTDDTEHSPDEDPERTPDEMLDWVCWELATDGERFYPPDETAEECIDALGITDESDRGWERGQHLAKYSKARTLFKMLDGMGFDPKARAQREAENTPDGVDLPPIDWAWLEHGDEDGGEDDA